MSKNSISTNQELRTGEYIESVNKKYYAILQKDSNLVIYKRDGGAMWASGTNGVDAFRLLLQPDGDLVMFNKVLRKVWHSRTKVEPSSSRMRLTITEEGFLNLDDNGKEVWSSRYSEGVKL